MIEAQIDGGDQGERKGGKKTTLASLILKIERSRGNDAKKEFKMCQETTYELVQL